MTSKSKRRSLKDCLRTILQPRRDSSLEPAVSNSAVLKQVDPSLVLLPSFSSVSLLPNYQAASNNKEKWPPSIPEEPIPPPRFIPKPTSHTEYIRNSHVPFSDSEFKEAYQAQAQLTELAGLSNFVAQPTWQDRPQDAYFRRHQSISSSTELARLEDVAHIFTTRPIEFGYPLTRFAETCSVPSIYKQGASQQASLATITSFGRSASTLRLQPSVSSLRPLPSIQAASRPDFTSTHTLQNFRLPHNGRRPRGLSSLPRMPSTQTVFSRSSTSTYTTTSVISTSAPCLEVEAGLSCINHFASFAVLDASEPTCPIVSLSADLRDVLSIGDQFSLDPKGVEGATMDTVTGLDADGNEVVHLLLYSPLLKPNSGRNRFVLASFLDVTEFIRDTATLPELEFTSEGSTTEDEIRTPQRPEPTRSPTYELLPEDLLGGCFVPERKPKTPVGPNKHDIWLDIASEESRRPGYKSSSRGSSTPRSSSSVPSSSMSVQNILDQFLLSLQEIYADFFVLGTSPFDECAYEICNVSPRVYASRDFIEGHLSKTPAGDKAYLETKLAQEHCFSMAIRWGRVGELKQLYCIPLFGRMSVTWVCFLVDGDRWANILPSW